MGPPSVTPRHYGCLVPELRAADRRPVGLLVTDLDNTLYDWVNIWHSSFGALLDAIVDISGIRAEVLKAEIRAIHQQRRTSEYSYLIQEIPSLAAKYDAEELAKVFEPAIRASREARHAAMRLYPTVLDTLSYLRERDVAIVAYTESLAFYTEFRLRRLGLDGLIDVLYSPRDHEFPDGVDRKSMRTRPADEYGLKRTRHRYTPAGLLKPATGVLGTIVDEYANGRRSIYVGDSLMKDVAMAQAVGIADVLAAYGAAQHRKEYQLLREVSHWTDEDVKREQLIVDATSIEPSFRLERSFSELLDIFEFSGS